jgi:hypothetical protein
MLNSNWPVDEATSRGLPSAVAVAVAVRVFHARKLLGYTMGYTSAHFRTLSL